MTSPKFAYDQKGNSKGNCLILDNKSKHIVYYSRSLTL